MKETCRRTAGLGGFAPPNVDDAALWLRNPRWRDPDCTTAFADQAADGLSPPPLPEVLTDRPGELPASPPFAVHPATRGADGPERRSWRAGGDTDHRHGAQDAAPREVCDHAGRQGCHAGVGQACRTASRHRPRSASGHRTWVLGRQRRDQARNRPSSAGNEARHLGPVHAVGGAASCRPPADTRAGSGWRSDPARNIVSFEAQGPVRPAPGTPGSRSSR